MQYAKMTLPPRSRIPASSVALTVEHGAWGFLFEPLLAGLLIAPSIAGAALSVFIIGSFLCRGPLKFVLGDALNRKKLPRTAIARRWLVYFGIVAAIGFTASLITANWIAFVPLLISAPVAVYLIFLDASRKSREALSELLAALVLGGSITTLMLAGGFGYQISFAMWLAMSARLVPSVVYVRNRLRLEKGKEYSAVMPLFTHTAAFAIVGILYLLRLGSILTVAVAVFLLLRSTTGLSSRRRKLTAKHIGIREVIYGVIYAVSLVAGYYLSI
jgi:hypothetical protein